MSRRSIVLVALVFAAASASADEGELLLDLGVTGNAVATSHPRSAAPAHALAPGLGLEVGARFGLTNELLGGLRLAVAFSPTVVVSPLVRVGLHDGEMLSRPLFFSAVSSGSWRWNSLEVFSVGVEVATGVQLAWWTAQVLALPSSFGSPGGVVALDDEPGDDISIAWKASIFAAADWRWTDELLVALGPYAALTFGSGFGTELGARLRLSFAASQFL